jgi:hypothetical protein
MAFSFRTWLSPSKRRIYFGHQKDREREITSMINHKRFICQFGELHTAHFANVDCIVPLDLPDYTALQNNINSPGTRFLSPRLDIANICDDKLLLNYLLLGGRFAELVPPLWKSNSGHFPYIVKKRRDQWGVNSFVIRNVEDELAMAPILQSPEYFCQTYISGTDEFALHVLMANGEVTYAQTVKYEMGQNVYVKGKNFSEKRRIYLPENEQMATFLPLLDALEYNGTCCINYKTDKGLPMLLEINPRVGQSLTSDINRYLEAYVSSLDMA